jgi:hypothetical protein
MKRRRRSAYSNEPSRETANAIWSLSVFNNTIYQKYHQWCMVYTIGTQGADTHDCDGVQLELVVVGGGAASLHRGDGSVHGVRILCFLLILFASEGSDEGEGGRRRRSGDNG